MNERLRSLLTYSGKCVTATLIVFLLSTLFNYHDIGWCLISVILVLSPDGKDALSLAITRIKANLVGASVGLVCLLFSPANMFTISIALTITLSLCYFFKFDAAVRSALAATIIIMLHEEGKHLWDTAIERVIAVLAGCILGLVITYVFHFKSRYSERKTGSSEEA
jgi:uncharacterized membrane protein YgaE (UPF0421/DUF939 family)